MFDFIFDRITNDRNISKEFAKIFESQTETAKKQ